MSDNVAYHKGRNSSIMEGSPDINAPVTQQAAPEGPQSWSPQMPQQYQMDPHGKGNDEYGISGDDSEFSDASYNSDAKGKTKGGKVILDPVKAAKKQEKKKRDMAQQLAWMTPFFMYTGAGRFLLTADNKRKIIKIS